MPETSIKELVTPEWLQAQIKERGIKQNDIVELTEVDQSNISAWIRGLRPMSASAKAMFYWFITAYDAAQILQNEV